MAIAVNNIPVIREALNKYGINNLKLQNSILAVIGKESTFRPQSENLNYKTADRIKKVFSSIPAAVIPSLVANPVGLGNYVYSNKYGTPAGAGYLYRGRGLNQITFLNNYKKVGQQIGVDLVSNPDLLNKIEYAAPAAAVFYRDSIKTYKNVLKNKYGVDLTAIKPTDNYKDILKAVVNINAGLGASNGLVNSEYGKSLPYYDLVLKSPNITTFKTILPIVLASVMLYYFFKK
jgi:putative chitinase